MARFVYFNKNPDGERESDCVTRAISLATGIQYAEIRKKLFHTSKLYGCPRLTLCCYSHLLDDVLKLERVSGEGMSVGEFADAHPYGTYLVRMGGHISTIVDNCIYDIWDCRREWVTDAWRVGY